MTHQDCCLLRFLRVYNSNVIALKRNLLRFPYLLCRLVLIEFDLIVTQFELELNSEQGHQSSYRAKLWDFQICISKELGFFLVQNEFSDMYYNTKSFFMFTTLFQINDICLFIFQNGRVDLYIFLFSISYKKQ